jgi:hypothetical protein
MLQTTKISFEHYGIKAQVEFPSDSNLTDTLEHIKYLLIAIGHNKQLVEEYINTEL